MNTSSSENHIETYRTAAHSPTEQTLNVTGIHNETGEEVIFESFRTTEEGVVSILRLNDPTNRETILHEVKIPGKIEVIKTHTLEVVTRNKGKIAVIGSIVITLAAGTGLVVKKLKTK